jgi:hypothetical protein
MKIFIYNSDETKNLYSSYNILDDISVAMKKLNDNNENNYIIGFIDYNIKFDENILKIYYKEYLEYLSKNPNIKSIIYTNGGIYGMILIKKYLNITKMHIYYKYNDYDIYKYNSEDATYLYYKLQISNNIDIAMKYFNDYNKDNYIICNLNIKYKEDLIFNENLYNIYHTQYLEYLSENPNIKLLIYTNSKYGSYWCNIFLKFINSYIYYKKNEIDDLDFTLNKYNII